MLISEAPIGKRSKSTKHLGMVAKPTPTNQLVKVPSFEELTLWTIRQFKKNNMTTGGCRDPFIPYNWRKALYQAYTIALVTHTHGSFGISTKTTLRVQLSLDRICKYHMSWITKQLTPIIVILTDRQNLKSSKFSSSTQKKGLMLNTKEMIFTAGQKGFFLKLNQF